MAAEMTASSSAPRLTLSIMPPSPLPVSNLASSSMSSPTSSWSVASVAVPITSIAWDPVMSEEQMLPADERNGFAGGYSEIGSHVITHGGHSILGDLKAYPLPDDIKNQADTIYNKMIYRVRRGRIRDRLLFFCTLCAYQELGLDVNPIELGEMFGLTPGEVQRCDSTFSYIQTGYRPPAIYTSALQYLPNYCRNMDLSEDAIEEVCTLARSILRKDPTLSQENPQTVAAGILRYYLVTTGITCDDPQQITRVTRRSTVTIDGMYRRISIVDNR